MWGVFWGATAFDQDLSAWDTSAVASMSNVFWDATAFDQDLSAWDVSAVAALGTYTRPDGTQISEHDPRLGDSLHMRRCCASYPRGRPPVPSRPEARAPPRRLSWDAASRLSEQLAGFRALELEPLYARLYIHIIDLCTPSP